MKTRQQCQNEMPGSLDPATSSKRRRDSAVTQAEREAKRRHKEACSIEIIGLVKDEPLPDESAITTSRFDTLNGVSSGASEGGDATAVNHTFNSFDQSIRVLALSFDAYDEGDDLAEGAFKTVLKRRLESVRASSIRGMPVLDLDEWMMGILQGMALPLEYHGRLCSALRKATVSHVMDAWLLEHDSTALPAVLKLLQRVLDHGNYAVRDIIQDLEGSQQQAEAYNTQEQSSLVSKTGLSIRQASFEPASSASAVTEARASKPMTPKETAKATPKQRKLKVQRVKKAMNTSRSKSVPISDVEKLSSEQENHESRLIPRSSPALMNTIVDCHDIKDHAGARVRSTTADRTLWKAIGPSISESSSRLSITLRTVKVDKSNLLLFFIGSGMKAMCRQDIIDACSQSYHKHPLHSYKWSDTIWVAQMNNMPEVSTDLITIGNHRFVATGTTSDPSHHFVACLNNFEVEDEPLKVSVERAIAELHRKKTPGRLTLYRITQAHSHARLVFLRLYKAPPKPLFPVPVVGSSGETHCLIFKPVIVDHEQKCLYCDQLHEENICPDAVQISHFANGARS